VGAQQRAHREGRRLVVVKGEGTPIDEVLNVAGLDLLSHEVRPG
jgi:hypothetical protein